MLFLRTSLSHPDLGLPICHLLRQGLPLSLSPPTVSAPSSLIQLFTGFIFITCNLELSLRAEGRAWGTALRTSPLHTFPSPQEAVTGYPGPLPEGKAE